MRTGALSFAARSSQPVLGNCSPRSRKATSCDAHHRIRNRYVLIFWGVWPVPPQPPLLGRRLTTPSRPTTTCQSNGFSLSIDPVPLPDCMAVCGTNCSRGTGAPKFRQAAVDFPPRCRSGLKPGARGGGLNVGSVPWPGSLPIFCCLLARSLLSRGS